MGSGHDDVETGFFEEPFSACRGVRQGDIASATIFNTVADAVIREAEAQFRVGKEGRLPVDTLFYADDGAIYGEDAEEVRKLFNIYTDTFARATLPKPAWTVRSAVLSRNNFCSLWYTLYTAIEIDRMSSNYPSLLNLEK